MSDEPIAAGVTSLLFLGRPTAIARSVVAIAVNAVNGMLRGGAWPHVLVEGHDRTKPPVADFDASAAVKFPLNVFWVRAAVNHKPPNAVLSGMSQAVFYPHFAVLFGDIAPAAFLPFLEISGGDYA